MRSENGMGQRTVRPAVCQPGDCRVKFLANVQTLQLMHGLAWPALWYREEETEWG